MIVHNPKEAPIITKGFLVSPGMDCNAKISKLQVGLTLSYKINDQQGCDQGISNCFRIVSYKYTELQKKRYIVYI